MAQSDELWEMKEHTHVKHVILAGYLEKWAAILGRLDKRGNDRTLHYIDTHAGRARYTDGEPGSPIIAMEVGHSLHIYLEGAFHLRCHNIEEDSDNFALLEREVNAARETFPSVVIHNYQGDFQEHIGPILASIPTNEAAFIFVDPFGYRDVNPSSMVRLLEGRRYHEIFLTFMSQFISRFISDETKHATLDTVLGTTEWRSFIGASNAEQKVVDLYARQIMSIARQRVGGDVLAYPIRIQLSKGQSPYYLIHVCRSAKGRKAMEEAVMKANSVPQNPLFTTGDVEKAVMGISSAHPGIRALDLAGKIWQSDLYVTWTNGIRIAIRTLSEQGALRLVDRNNQERKMGVLPHEADQVYPTGKKPQISNTLF